MSTASPDRFVPLRVPIPDRFRANKEPHQLSTSERLLRNDRADPDAFCFVPKRSTPRLPRRNARSDGLERRLGTVLNLNSDRQVSNGAVWSVGGTVPSGHAVDGGRGQLVNSGTNARLYNTSFCTTRPKSEEDQEKHEGRLALALKIDRVQRVLDFDGYSTFPRCRRNSLRSAKTIWTGTEWSNDAHIPKLRKEERVLPSAPFKVLDAPGLRDDFYCSIMDYSKSCNTLAVGLGNLLYGWSESSGVTLLNAGAKDGSWLTSVAFSSDQGSKSILAFGRSSGSLSLMSLFDSLIPRFDAQQPAPVACLAWRPTPTTRGSLHPGNPGVPVQTEDLLEVARNNWPGTMTLLAKIKVHSQQICGLAWCPNGMQFATGGNDNLCCLFQVEKIIDTTPDIVTAAHASMPSSDTIRHSPGSATDSGYETGPPSPERKPPQNSDAAGNKQPQPQPQPQPQQQQSAVRNFPAGSERHRWRHGAAVKAIAFCPWREGLMATGGGSNDKCIHFYHTTSGAALATISVAAQVTSLLWSTTRREIAATFGYAQPDHPYRIAVFSWPDCRQVAAVPWEGEHRALYAIAYPGGPSDTYRTKERLKSRTAAEGCIVVASSDESVKFHEVWTAGRKATALGSGVLGGSDILEMEEGIDKEGDVIR
ncbi:WD40 repeat-like protein [Xylariomycetidae sp. FL2044]|nr:WD40 repeat-like protein [Xylariomycetidae sp. FL2044]